MAPKVAVVTGGNRGIGLEIVRGLSKKLSGYDILLTARDPVQGQSVVHEMEETSKIEQAEDGGERGTVKFFQLDITNQEQINKLKEHLQDTYGGLDVLVNNAGTAYKTDSQIEFAKQAEVTIETNFRGTLKVCDALFPLLQDGARVVHVSSRASTFALKKMSPEMRQKFYDMKTIDELKEEIHNFLAAAAKDDHDSKGYSNSAYGMSKLAVTVMTEIQQHEIKEKSGKSDIIINSCCPGHVDTAMSSHKGELTVEEGADTPIYLATLSKGASSPKGKFVAERKVIDWRKAHES